MISLGKKANYIQRVLSSYIFSKNSQLTFWHEVPAINQSSFTRELGQYYMTFAQKAAYPGPFDEQGIPLLDYHGKVGRQYNPIAIAQYALAHYNLAKANQDTGSLNKFGANAQWLLNNLDLTSQGTYLWPHHFDFEYFRPLKAPWYSGLAQGQGLSVLVRGWAETGEEKFRAAADRVFQSLSLPVQEGGVLYYFKQDQPIIEEYLVDPPTHILNGFIWALWGVYDYFLLTHSDEARALFEACTQTILAYLPAYDLRFWSLYELTPQRLQCIASPFYHHLHIIQLQIMFRLTGNPGFARYSQQWEGYTKNPLYKTLALMYKSIFKLVYY
jgi:hypothetical protein